LAWSAAVFFVVYEVVSHFFVWWAIQHYEHPGSMVGFAGWAMGLETAFVSAVVVFIAVFIVLTRKGEGSRSSGWWPTKLE
jgi:hypothetical protein